MFDKDACSIQGGDSIKWTWGEYYKQCDKLTQQGSQVVLVDMINQPVPGSVPLKNELFESAYPDGTYFVLYCHSGGSSGFLQKQLSEKLPQYHIVNMTGGIGMYEPEQGRD
ncbi:MAG: hypothetical protein CO132_04260 [Candidatus Kerfeldbacteria bacterium CG_4_9_14_3_um_filter_45_8]|nr:MAG: hypothetical protein CO132_04260 [Candidatus Kerfeldbacteria bacterium CG_4_9_14_3_um_filter_45_8]